MLLMAAFLIASTPPASTTQPASPAPDPLPTTGQLALTSAAVCAGSCLASGAGLILGLNGKSPVFIAAGPVLGLAGSAIGGGLAESVTPEPDRTDSQAAWGALCAAGGYLLVGGAAATIGYIWGASTSDDAPLLAGGLGALGLGAAGGAIGAGAGTFLALTFEPPQF
jgi:hypothetical protein